MQYVGKTKAIKSPWPNNVPRLKKEELLFLER
jgi:hypothetical protein